MAASATKHAQAARKPAQQKGVLAGKNGDLDAPKPALPQKRTAYNRVYQQNRRAAAARDNKCIECADKPRKDGSTRCSGCLKRARDLMREKRGMASNGAQQMTPAPALASKTVAPKTKKPPSDRQVFARLVLRKYRDALDAYEAQREVGPTPSLYALLEAYAAGTAS